jgi:DNA-binding transcriptional MocR family regulator
MSPQILEKEYLYEQIAGRISELIQHGTLQAGEKLPSIRRLSQQEKVSISTVMQAYYWLESKGLIEARPQSGFYVCLEPRTLPPEPEMSRPSLAPCCLTISDHVAEVVRQVSDRSLVPFGVALPSPEHFPNRKLGRILSSAARRDPAAANTYDLAPGNLELRRQVARRSMYWGGTLSPRDIVVTCGCTEAINLCLRAVTQPGDIVAVESPTFFGFLDILETLGLQSMEICTCPSEGIHIESLEEAMDKAPIKACIVMANAHNPLGSSISDRNKKRLVDLATARAVPLIEDDVYGDLHFGPDRPRTLKSFDRDGWVLLCSSFSKTLAPGYRVGWVAPGRFRERLIRLKRAGSIGNAVLPQLMIARFLENGSYDLHLRKLRKTYIYQIDRMIHSISRFFPKGTRVTRPRGGHIIWVELPDTVDSLELQQRALDEKISLVPGTIFSAEGDFRNFIRLNAGIVWGDRIERALMILGRLTEEMTM